MELAATTPSKRLSGKSSSVGDTFSTVTFLSPSFSMPAVMASTRRCEGSAPVTALNSGAMRNSGHPSPGPKSSISWAPPMCAANSRIRASSMKCSSKPYSTGTSMTGSFPPPCRSIRSKVCSALLDSTGLVVVTIQVSRTVYFFAMFVAMIATHTAKSRHARPDGSSSGANPRVATRYQPLETRSSTLR